MSHILAAFASLTIGAVVALAADPAPKTISAIFDGQLKSAESEIVSLAEAMPADKYDFAPTNGEFKGVRTFSQQMTHLAAVIYAVSSSVLGEKNPTEMGKSENGPGKLKGKEAVVKYLKDAFAYGHKAMGTLTDKNLTELVPSAFGNNKVSRVYMADAAIWHSFNHYGQAVIYARMNGIVPPASRQ